jgi:type IVB pilus formation R64 PilN family outer membrane protein
MRLKKQFSVGLLAIALVGCSTPKLYHQAEQNVDNIDRQMDEARQSDRYPVVHGVTKRAMPDNSFNMHPALPAWGQTPITINSRSVPLQFLVDKVLSRTGAMVDYHSDVNQNMPVSLNYTGTVQGALERLAAASNYAYTLEDNTVIWSGFVTKTFDISFMPGVSQYQMGRASGGQAGIQGAEGNAFGMTDNGSQYSNLQGTLSVWNDLTATLNNLKSQEGKIFVSQATTTVTVNDRPQNMRVIATYLRQLNRELSRQVSLDVQVLQIDLSDAYEYGINWNKIRAFVSHGTEFGFSGSMAQSINLQPINGQSDVDSGFIMQGKGSLFSSEGGGILVKALGQQGKVSVVTQPRTVTLNNQVAELSINNQKTYLRQVSVTTLGGTTTGTSTSVTPGVVSTGFNLYILPKIQGNNVYLQISSTLANLVNMATQGFEGTGGSGKFTIQMPEIDEKRFNQRTLVPSSATLVVAGFKQQRNQANKQQLFGQQALGGHGAEKVDSEIILLITPTILETHK